MKASKLLILIVSLFLGSTSAQPKPKKNKDPIMARVDSIMKLMTLDEKVGQLNHLTSDYSTDIYERGKGLDYQISSGRVGAITPFAPIDTLIKFQHLAVDRTRMHIPLLYASDVLHGYPGTMGGFAIADILSGTYNPSGKITMTFPRHQGQVPIYYNQLAVGRVRLGPDDRRWGVSK